MPKSKIKIEFHHEGFDELRRDPGVAEALHESGEAIANAAGGAPDFVVESELTRSRARTVVRTDTIEGMVAEARDRALTKAIDAGR